MPFSSSLMKSILIIAMMCVTCYPASVYDTSNNVFTNNPSFENNYSGWYNAGGSVDSSTASDGSKSGRLNATTGQRCDWRSYSYSSVSGKKYQLSFDYMTSEGAAGKPQARLRFHQSGTGIFKGEAQRDLSLTDGKWETITLSMTCPPEGDIVDLFYTVNTFGSFTGYAWLDNVRLYPEIEVNELPYHPKDGSRGWSDELILRWPETSGAAAYLVYTGTDYDEVDSASLPVIPGDFSFNAKVDLVDFSLVAKQWLLDDLPEKAPIADLNSDQVVDILDLQTIATYFLHTDQVPTEFKSPSYQNRLKVRMPSSNQEYYWRVDALVNGQVEKGVTMQFQCEDYLDYGIQPPKTIYYISDSDLSRTEKVTFQSLQGLLARTRPELFIRTNSNAVWLSDMDYNYSWISQRSISSYASQAGKSPIEWTLSNYSGSYDYYLVCDAYNDPHSLTAAVSAAAALDRTIIVDISDIDLMSGLGKTMYADVRGVDEKFVWDYFKDQDIFTKKAIFVQRDDINTHGPNLRDLPIAIRALSWWHSSQSYTEEVFSVYEKNIPCYGWDSPVMSGEGGAVRYHSEHSMYTVVTDWSINLSTYAGMASYEPKITFSQPCSDNVYTPEDNVHYVCFCISDMDNANTIFDGSGWAQNSNRYASPHRGKFAMGWGMPPAMAKLGPSVLKWWYRRATENDCFIGYCSGMDYFNPSHFPDLDIHTSHLAKYLKECDMKTMLIIDGVLPEKNLTQDYYETAKWFTDIDQLRGLFYLEYVRYAPHGGKIFWFDGKPMVTARFDFRDNAFYSAVRVTPEDLANSINAMPTNPYDDSGYSFVTVHAWSRGWNEVAECVELLNDNVRVVTPNEMIEQLYLHGMAPEN